MVGHVVQLTGFVSNAASERSELASLLSRFGDFGVHRVPSARRSFNVDPLAEFIPQPIRNSGMTQTLSQAEAAELITFSYGRSIANPTFFDDFYNRFTSQSPVIRDMFKNTDMTAQKQALRSGIAFLTQFAKGSAYAEQKVDALGKSHSRSELNVNPNLYPLWVSALIETFAQHDPEWDSELGKLWQETLQKGIDRITSRY